LPRRSSLLLLRRWKVPLCKRFCLSVSEEEVKIYDAR
jgi:hypothetical protein